MESRQGSVPPLVQDFKSTMELKVCIWLVARVRVFPVNLPRFIVFTAYKWYKRL